jgi:uncharacterized RDD family membrane protein YckC
MAPPMGGMPLAAGGQQLASPGLRIVGGLIDVVVITVANIVINLVFALVHLSVIAWIPDLLVDVGYLAYFWSSQGATPGMMAFGFKVRDAATGQYPDLTKAAIRGVVWVLEVGFTICLIGALGWLWQLWDPQKQAIHDKAAGTIVTVS